MQKPTNGRVVIDERMGSGVVKTPTSELRRRLEAIESQLGSMRSGVGNAKANELLAEKGRLQKLLSMQEI